MFGIPTLPVVTKTLAATTNSVTLYYASPGGTPRHLVVRINSKCESSQPSNGIRFNGDSGSNYNRVHVQGSGSTPSAGVSGSSDKIHAGQNESGTNEFGATEILIPDAFSTRSHKSTISLNGATEDSAQTIGGRWANTAAITSVTIFTSGVHYSVGSTFELCVVDESFNVNEQIITGSNAAFASVTEDGSNFPTDNGDLVVISNVRNATAGTAYNAYLMPNGDTTGSNYEFQRLGGYNGGGYGSRGNSQSNGAVPGNAATAGTFGGGVHHIASYSDTVGHKILNSLTAETTNTNTNDMIVQRTTTRWANTGAVSNFLYQPSDGGSWLVGSMLSTYRIPSTGTNFIERQELTGTTTTVTFSSIPQNYDHLELVSYVRGSRSAAGAPTYMTFNSDTTAANYDVQQLQANGGTVSSYTGTANPRFGVFPAASEGSGQFGASTTTFYNYTKTDRHQAYLTAMGSTGYTIENFSHRWESTAAITQIVLTINGGGFVAGTTFELRGISATPSSSDAANVNTVAIASVAAINAIAIASIQAMNTVAFAVAGGGGSAYAGITWSTDDAMPVAADYGVKFGNVGAQGYVNCNDGSATGALATYEHNGSSWSTTGNCATVHGVAAGGGTQSAGIVANGQLETTPLKARHILQVGVCSKLLS